MKITRALLVVVLSCTFAGLTAQSNERPRVIVMTDGEIDDHSSMIRFLLYACDMDVLSIIETNSIFQKNGHSKEDWYEKQLEAYKQIYPNLILHNPNYPTYEKLKRISCVGDEDISHIKDLDRYKLVPGGKITYQPDNWPDTPGSDSIVKILLDADPRPVYIQAWGGGNTAARAFYKLKTQYPKEYDRAVSKVIIYNIWYQDGAGNYIENVHPKVEMVYCGSFAGTWNYNSQTNTTNFITNNVKKNHGPLGALYPQTYVSEGDSPALLYFVANGLRNHEHPTFGGWGGRYTKFSKFEKVYVDAKDDGDIKKPLRRWIDDANRNFQARIDWCVATTYASANHEPISAVLGGNVQYVTPGSTVTLNASPTIDPDGNTLTYSWWQYYDADNATAKVSIINNTSPTNASFVVPNEVGKQLHIILEVTDDGSPKLESYQRVIYHIVNSLDVENEAYDSQVNVFPNPVNDLLSLELGHVFNEECTIQMYDQTNRLVYQKKVQGTSHTIEMADVAPGIYLAKISSPRLNLTKRIIKIK